MPTLTPIPRAAQRDERWANGAGSTRVVLREPDATDWRVRVSVARVDTDGPFSELPGTRRTLVPLDAPVQLRFADGSTRRAARLQPIRFAGAPAPRCHLPAGPTRDFNLMLRGEARGEVLPRTLAGPMPLSTADAGWLVWLASGQARVRVAGNACTLGAGDAVRVSPGHGAADGVLLEGTGEILLVKLYA